MSGPPDFNTTTSPFSNFSATLFLGPQGVNRLATLRFAFHNDELLTQAHASQPGLDFEFRVSLTLCISCWLRKQRPSVALFASWRHVFQAIDD